MINEGMIREMLFTNPLSLLAIKDKQVIDYVNNLVPYSSAFEIECDKGPSYTEESFIEIPDIMSVNNGSGEQRYRIPNGLRGIICLYHISYQLKLNSLLNPHSSIHYHCDCTDCFQEIRGLFRDKENIQWVLDELNTWLEGDIATNRGYGNWFKCNDLQTIEYRLGEMTFDYKIILKRIIHCNAMTKKFKLMCKSIREVTFEEVDIKRVIAYGKTLSVSKNILFSKLNNYDKLIDTLKNSIVEIKEDKPIKTPKEIAKEAIKNRLISINTSKENI